MSGIVRRGFAIFLLVATVILIPVQQFAQSLPALQATLQGIITNAANGLPVVGAKILVNGKSALSTSGGVYSLAIEPVGTFPVSCTKTGFDNFTSLPVIFQQGVVSVLNIQLWENLNPPSNVSVFINTAPQYIPVSWNAPSGNYELIYDDGIQDNFTVWSAAGNMNAVKFTPAGFPVKLTGGSVHIGSSANYPAGSNPLVPFQVRVYDATGTGGTPGNSVAGPFEIIPAAFGWIEFTLPLPVSLPNGSFYIAMVQGGSAPNAAGLAIDETMPQFRSFARFASGGGPWVPSGGNFMMRARCMGPGGPVLLADEPSVAGIYNIYRLRQGEEQNPMVWTLVGSTVATSFIDTSWSLLPCGPYRWGVKAQYPGNRWSPAGFSNILGKCWTAPVNIHLDYSCGNTTPGKALIRLINLVYPDTIYSRVPDSAGNVLFPNVWKGTYQMIASRFGYDTLFYPVPVAAPVLLNLTLLQVTTPPANLVVNDSSLLARWDVPHFEKQIFMETWSSGTFTANSWSVDGGNNWTISSSLGRPSPSAMFASLPLQSNYTQSLVSKTISGEHSTLLKLEYDIFLDNYATTMVNQMAVEIWDGLTWHTVKAYTNIEGDIPWTSEDLDISDYTDLSFRIRFRAGGENSGDINNWNIDNIAVKASEPAQEQAVCILGYYFYLENAITGYTTENIYPIPANLIQYGQTYHACVRALYGSGYSDSTCTTFTSHFLCPVQNLNGYPVEDVAFINWEKPLASTDTSFITPPGLIGYTVIRDDSVIATIPDADTLSYYDSGLEPGYYWYGVAARYDLAFYGFPGQVGESVAAGPLQMAISWGRELPFFEAWNSGSYSYNDWRFTPSQGNWVIDPAEGLPSPAANFRWYPPLVNYTYSLESPSFNGVPYTCAAIWLDFDLKLNDRNYTGTEKMIVEAYYNNDWHKKAEISNTGNIPWTNYHIDISPARGKGFRVRFRATGQNSSEILNWFIDNIDVYPVCYPAANLAGQQVGNTVSLTWNPPACLGGNLLNEGFEQAFFPPPQWALESSNPSATWSHNSTSSFPGVHNGSFSAALDWDYNHQDEWLIAKNIFVNGDLTFWSYAFQGSPHHDHYYVKVSADHGATWNVMMDMSALPTYPGGTGVNAWTTPYHVDLSMYDGETVDIAWHAVDGDGNGLWYPWAVDDCSIGADDHQRQQLLGYDIYRKESGVASFSKINASLVNDTAYADEGLPPGQYQYYVLARFAECENGSNSDTVLVDVITGLDAIRDLSISVFPNPVTDHFTIVSASELTEIILLETTGRIAGCWRPAEKFRTTIDTQGLHDGFYLLRIRTEKAIKNVKICLIK